MIDPPVRIGRCQHCQQVRPVFHYDHRYDNGEAIWDEPLPDWWLDSGAWLCARDWSEAETARVNGQTFYVDHMIEVRFWKEREGHGPMNARIFINGGELLTQADQDRKTCEAILSAS